MKKPVKKIKSVRSAKPRRVAETRAAYSTKRATPPVPSTAPRSQHDAEFMRALKKEKVRLQTELKKQQVASQDHPTTGNHMADDATDVAEQAKTLALRTHLEGMLKEVERAIVRIERGTYGACEKCGKPIGDERLRAMPWVTLCIEHAKISQMPRLKATTVA